MKAKNGIQRLCKNLYFESKKVSIQSWSKCCIKKVKNCQPNEVLEVNEFLQGYGFHQGDGLYQADGFHQGAALSCNS